MRLLYLLPLVAANGFYKEKDGTTYITANADKFSKLASSLGVTRTEFQNIYAYLYESFSGSIPLETFEAFQTNAVLAASVENKYDDWAKTHSGAGGTTALTFGVVLTSLGFFLL
ncbi:hypothetical protein DICA4_E20626 [Diutina catenulata]